MLLFVSGEYPPDVGGVGDYTAALRRTLVARGWNSRVLSRHQVRRWDARSLLGLVRAAPRDGLVHIQFQAAAYDLLGDVCVMPWLVHRLRPRTRVVTTFHDVRVPYLFPRAGPLRGRAVRFLARTSDAIVAADEADLSTLGGPSPRHVRVPIGPNVPCSPPLGFDRSAFRATLGFAPETLALVYFGLLNASKGLDLLLDSFERVSSMRSNVKLVLLGGDVGASDPTDRTTAARIQSRLRASGGRILRTGWLPPADVSAHLLAADIAVLPYLDGASGRRGSLLACAEHGLPVVSTRPASPEVADAIHAVPPSASALAEAILQVAAQPTLAAHLRSASGDLARSMSWSAVAERHIKIYSELLAT